MAPRPRRRDRRTAGRLAALAALALAAAGCSEAPQSRLPALAATIGETSVSGISSGAYMAGQFQLAHGRIVVGAAIIAGGPYGCAESVFADAMPGPGTALLNLSKAVNGCMQDGLRFWGIPNPKALAERAARLAAKDRIDPLTAVAGDRIYLFSGREDRIVRPSIVAAAAAFYREIGVPPAQIMEVTEMPAGHAFVTLDKGEACDRSGAPYVVDCDYDQAGALLAHAYGPLAPPATRLEGEFLRFDQREFATDQGLHGLADQGVAYVPADCRARPGCRVHIAFHGCAQNRALVGDAFIADTGFARWADRNRLIVLFPQTAATPMNPQACWDWWGYTGSEFLTRSAPQTVAVRRMLDRLASPR
jgi:poly(3-hydroxybutyrate) depolymerase